MTNNLLASTSNLARPRWLLPLLAVVGVIALAVGAYCNWYLWHPMSGIVPTMAAAVLILIGGVSILIRNRRVRPVALVLLVMGVGTIVGQNVGPDRPSIRQHDGGSVRLVATGPAPFEGSGTATCSSVADGSQIVVSPDEFGLAREAEDADFHYVYITIGDMYDYGDPGRRADHLSIMVLIQPALVPADGKPAETRLTSDAASLLVLAPGHTVDGGSITFSNLSIGDPADPARRSDLSGTITWTCDPVAPDGAGPGVEAPLEKPAPKDVPLPS